MIRSIVLGAMIAAASMSAVLAADITITLKATAPDGTAIDVTKTLSDEQAKRFFAAFAHGCAMIEKHPATGKLSQRNCSHEEVVTKWFNNVFAGTSSEVVRIEREHAQQPAHPPLDVR